MPARGRSTTPAYIGPVKWIPQITRYPTHPQTALEPPSDKPKLFGRFHDLVLLLLPSPDVTTVENRASTAAKRFNQRMVHDFEIIEAAG